jgi:transcription antitermination factor NusA-like protein
MTAVIDMKAMRYINLLDKVSRVKTRRCFTYNNAVFFAVNKNQVSQAIGPAASNIRAIQESLGMRVKIIKEAEGINDARRFIEDIVSPIRPKDIEVKDGAMLITAGNTQNKASLIGRDKRRLEELKLIVQENFSLELKIL